MKLFLTILFSTLISTLIMMETALCASLRLSAKLTDDGAEIERGIKWRIFVENQNEPKNLEKIIEETGGTIFLNLEPATYFIHAGFGQIGDIRPVYIGQEDKAEIFVFNAGGVLFSGKVADKQIFDSKLKFNIYEKEIGENNKRALIAENIKADEIFRLKQGMYHVVSEYGNVNVSTSVDLEIRAGQITDITMQHRAAKVSMKLVSNSGGAAVANVVWSVLTEQGKKVFQSALIQPELILAEGKYQASVKYGENTYMQEFDINSGENKELEILIAN